MAAARQQMEESVEQKADVVREL
jgi:adenylate cyclase class IV